MLLNDVSKNKTIHNNYSRGRAMIRSKKEQGKNEYKEKRRWEEGRPSMLKKDKIYKNILEKNRKESKVNEKYIALGFY